jgi:hypothetical protein
VGVAHRKPVRGGQKHVGELGGVVTLPEPQTWALLGGGLLLLVAVQTRIPAKPEALNPNSEIELGARPRRKPGRAGNSQRSGLCHPQPPGREARPATPGAGVLPNFSIRAESFPKARLPVTMSAIFFAGRNSKKHCPKKTILCPPA